ncbi:MAG: hypothetical protein KAS40_13950 [Desulfobacterales bacterium]|nr:hypothetical protein [Desulfobacterales bacterium]
MKKGIVFETMQRLTERLESEGIPYAVIGDMALAAHGYVRMTLDVDILLTRDGLARFRKKLARPWIHFRFSRSREIVSRH